MKAERSRISQEQDTEGEDEAGPVPGNDESQIGGREDERKKDKQNKRKLACMPCRDIKARCLLTDPSSAPQDPCKRCVRLGLHCVYTPKRRPMRYTKVGAGSGRTGDGRDESSNPDSPAGVGSLPPDARAANGPPGQMMEYAYAVPIDPALSKYPQQSHPAITPSASAIWGTFPAASPYGAMGEYDTSATRSSIQPSNSQSGLSHDPRGNTSIGEEGFPMPGFSRRPTEYGMSATGSESDPSPGMNTAMLPHGSSTHLSGPSSDMVQRSFATHGSTPARAATGMDIVSDLSHMRSSAAINGRVDDTYRLPLPASAFPTTSGDAPGGAARPGYGRYHGGASFDVSSSRDQDRNGRVIGADILPQISELHFKTSSTSMIAHSPPREAIHIDSNPHAQQEPTRGQKRRRTMSPPSIVTDKGKSTTTGIAAVDSVGGMINPGRYDAVRYNPEDAEENGRGIDWISLVMRKRVGFEGTECPDTLGIVTEDEVRFLFEQYHNKLNTYVGLLDPSLHTVSYLRTRSAILMTAICCAAAQAYLSEKYLPLIARANFMIGRAFERADVNLELCQALSILSMWKDGVESTDRGAWLKVGQAIRIGYALGLDKPGPRPLPENELQARQIVDRERAWKQLSAFDRSLEHSYGARSRMIPDSSVQDVEKWVLDHPSVVCHADAMLACSATVGFILLTISTHMKTAADDAMHRMVLHTMQNDFELWKEKWLGDHPPAKLHPTSRAIVGFYGTCVAFDISAFKRRCFEKSRTETQLILEAANEALTVLEYIVNDLVPHDVLSFAPDIVPIKAARSAVFLVSHLGTLGPALALKVTSLIQEIADQFKQRSRGKDIAYYQHKFFSRLLSIATPGVTRHASRRASPGLGLSVRTTNTGSALRQEEHEDGGTPVDAQNLAQRISISIDSAPSDSRAVVLDDQALMDDLLMQSQDWFPLDLFTGNGSIL